MADNPPKSCCRRVFLWRSHGLRPWGSIFLGGGVFSRIPTRRFEQEANEDGAAC